MSENIYYVYVYCNPLKNNEPFYVGKGKGNRWKKHLVEKTTSKGRINKHKIHTIQKIQNAGLEVIIEKVLENVDEKTAFEKEIELIKLYGRVDLGLGSLVNLDNGGKGKSGYIFTEEQLKNRTGENNYWYGKTGEKSHMFGRKLSEETKKKISESQSGEKNGFYGKKHSEKTKKKLSQPRTPMEKRICPHCGKIGASNQMTRYHFNNCKNLKVKENE